MTEDESIPPEVVSAVMKALAAKRQFRATQRVCACGCGREFEGKGRARYYSDACRQKAHRERHKGEA